MTEDVPPVQTRPVANDSPAGLRIPLRPGAVLRAARHHRRTRPILAALLIVLSLVAVRAERNRARALRDDWGPAVTTWTAALDLDAGHVLLAGDLVVRDLPPVALPTDAVRDAPLGRRLADPVSAGEIIRLGRLQGGDVSPNGALVGPGRGAVSLTSPSPHLAVGDRVDLYGLLDGDLVADRSEVIAISDGLAVVAVEARFLPAVIRALTLGDVVPVLVG